MTEPEMELQSMKRKDGINSYEAGSKKYNKNLWR